MVDDWWPLSGQEGEEKEGLLHLILSLQQLPPGSAVRLPAGGVAPSLTGDVFLCRVNIMDWYWNSMPNFCANFLATRWTSAGVHAIIPFQSVSSQIKLVKGSKLY